MNKCKFKVGDIISGKAVSLYRVTNSAMTRGEVVHVFSNLIKVKIIEHDDKYNIGKEFIVDPKYFELVGTPKQEKVVIYRNGQSVIAKDVNSGKTAEARCNPADAFDFAIGAKLALERLTGERSEEKARLVFYDNHFGYIGTRTNLYDAVHRPLCVGDVVEVFCDGVSHGEQFVVRDEDKAFVMGIKDALNFDWYFIKTKSYEGVVDGEKYGHVSCVRPK